MRQECGVKKGVYCFFTPGSASLNNKVTALATVTTTCRDTHTHSQLGSKIIMLSLVNSVRTTEARNQN